MSTPPLEIGNTTENVDLAFKDALGDAMNTAGYVRTQFIVVESDGGTPVIDVTTANAPSSGVVRVPVTPAAVAAGLYIGQAFIDISAVWFPTLKFPVKIVANVGTPDA